MKKSATGSKTDGRRVSRFEHEIQSIVSLYIIQNLQSELPGLVTIGRVHVPADLRTANIYVSLLGINQNQTSAKTINQTSLVQDQDLKLTLKILQSWAKDIQSEIDRKLKMKYVPKLTFFADEATEKILKIEKLLSGMNTNEDVRKDIEDLEDEDI